MRTPISARWTVSIRFSTCAALVTGTVALVSLVGWSFQLDVLKSGSAHWVAMNPLTALCFLASVGAIFLLFDLPPGVDTGRRKKFAQAVLVAVGGLSLLRLLAYAMGWEAGVDTLLFRDQLASTGTGLPNRMAPNTALNFFLLSLGLLLLDSRQRSLVFLSQVSSLIVFLTSLTSLVGYLVDAPGLYQPLDFIAMAANTAGCFVLTSLAALAVRKDRGLAKIIMSPRLGGNMARRFLPVAILAPLLTLWLLIQGFRAGLYESSFGIGVLILSNVLTLVAFTLHTAHALNRIDSERKRNWEELRATAQRLNHALRISHSAIVHVEEDSAKISFYGPSAQALFHYEPEQVLGQPLSLLLPDFSFPVRRFSKAIFPEHAAFQGNHREMLAQKRDGSRFFAEAFLSESDPERHHQLALVIRDISDRKRIEEEVLHRERLTAANEELESFSYSVSHDLRAPLRHIDGFVQLLQKRVNGHLDEKGGYYLSVIADSAKQMGTLIDDLLSFSRMTRTEISKTETDLNLLVEEVIRGLTQDLVDRKIIWRISALGVHECDPAMIRQVYSNLIGNAIKFTRASDPAVIEVGAMDLPGRHGQKVFFVRDNGVGFDMEYKEKLFGVFQRLHRQDEFEGTGIGLANVKRIVNRHGGEAWAEGDVGKGATLYFSLPKKVEIV